MRWIVFAGSVALAACASSAPGAPRPTAAELDPSSRAAVRAHANALIRQALFYELCCCADDGQDAEVAAQQLYDAALRTLSQGGVR
jgi:hypothetical protein